MNYQHIDSSDMTTIFEIARVALDYDPEFIAESLDIGDDEAARIKAIVEAFLGDSPVVEESVCACCGHEQDAHPYPCGCPVYVPADDAGDVEAKAREILTQHPNVVDFIVDRASCDGYVNDGIIPMPTTGAGWLAWIEDEIEIQGEHITDLDGNPGYADSLPAIVTFREALQSVATQMRKAGITPGKLPWQQRFTEIHWWRCNWHNPPCGWQGTSIEAGWDEDAQEWTCPRCGGSEKLRDLGIVPESVLKYAQISRADFYDPLNRVWETVKQAMPMEGNLHAVIVHAALVAGHQLPVSVAAEYAGVIDALEETCGCYLSEEPGWKTS
jgi:hypothetical protein